MSPTPLSETPLSYVDAFGYVNQARGLDTYIQDRDQLFQSYSKPLQGKNDLARVIPLSFWEDILSCMCLFVFPGCMFWLPLGSLTLFIYLVYNVVLGVSSAVYTSLLISFLTFWLFFSFHDLKFSSSFYSNRFCLLLLKYFSFKLVFDDTPKPNRHYVFVGVPHGVLPFGNFLSMIATHYISGYPLRGLASDAAFYAPLFRHFVTWFGCVPASKPSALKQLANAESVGIAPDGVAGIFHTNSQDQMIFIKKRKGFVRLAIETGVPIVPTYIFGNTELLNVWYDEKGWFKQMSRVVKFGLILLWGRFGLPIMKRVPITVVLGKPIEVVQDNNPSKEVVEKVHAQFLQDMKELFDKYKGFYGWEDKEIVFI